MNSLILFAFGFIVGVVAAFAAIATALFLAYGRKPTHPHDPELDMLLREIAASQGWYDEMCRDCGEVGGHIVGCPQLERSR